MTNSAGIGALARADEAAVGRAFQEAVERMVMAHDGVANSADIDAVVAPAFASLNKTPAPAEEVEEERDEHASKEWGQAATDSQSYKCGPPRYIVFPGDGSSVAFPAANSVPPSQASPAQGVSAEVHQARTAQ